jgi:hypothetical protein
MGLLNMKLIFLDNSFIDCTFKTRCRRQLEQILNLLKKIYKKISSQLNKFSLSFWKIKNKFKKKINYSCNGFEIIGGSSAYSLNSKDMTLDGYINKYGGIYNHGDGKHYDSKRSYMEALKQKGQHIKDY